MKIELINAKDAPWIPGAAAKLANGNADYVEDQLRRSIDLSDHAFAATLDDDVACAWGVYVTNISLSHAYIWIHVTPLVNRSSIHRSLFAEKVKEVIEKMQNHFPFMYGHIDPVMGPGARKWIHWLGFNMGEGCEIVTARGQKILAESFSIGERS